MHSFQNINEALSSGIYSQVTTDVFKYTEDFKISSKNTEMLDYIIALYLNYHNSLSLLDGYLISFLKTLRQEEIINNQTIEGISPFLLKMYATSNSPAASINCHNLKKEQPLDLENLCKIHSLLLTGIATPYNTTNLLRTDNSTFVGSFQNGKKIVDYFPIDYKDIDFSIREILKLYNLDKAKTREEIFINPILIELLTSSLQCFKDGNTRLARILKSSQLWHLSKNSPLNINPKLPILYTSEAMYKLEKRNEFRKIVFDFSKTPSNEYINDYLYNSLELIEKQIYLNQNKLAECCDSINKIYNKKF